MFRHAPSRAPIISASLHSAGVVGVALYYLSLRYAANTYIAWPISENGVDILVIQWESGDEFYQRDIPLNHLVLTVDQLTVVQGWLD